jgi:hypothetical protein
VGDTPAAGDTVEAIAKLGKETPERVAVNEVKTEAREGVLNGTPFLYPPVESARSIVLQNQLFERGSDFRHDLRSMMAKDFLVIELDDTIVLARSLGLDVKANRIVVHVGSLAELDEARGIRLSLSPASFATSARRPVRSEPTGLASKRNEPRSTISPPVQEHELLAKRRESASAR